MADHKYIRWDDPKVETIQPGEKEKIEEVSAQFNRFQMMNFNEHMHCLRGTHLKTQGVGYTPSVFSHHKLTPCHSVSWASSTYMISYRRIWRRACSPTLALSI